MVTYKTLENFLKKVKGVKAELDAELSSAREHLRFLEDSNVSVMAQINTLEQLMDADNPQSVELPSADEDIEKLFEERLGKAEFPDAEQMHKERQEGVYKREALGIVDQIDDINSESPEVDTP